MSPLEDEAVLLQSQGLILLVAARPFVNLCRIWGTCDLLVAVAKRERPRNFGRRKLELPVLVRRFANHNIYIYVYIYTHVYLNSRSDFVVNIDIYL